MSGAGFGSATSSAVTTTSKRSAKPDAARTASTHAWVEFDATPRRRLRRAGLADDLDREPRAAEDPKRRAVRGVGGVVEALADRPQVLQVQVPPRWEAEQLSDVAARGQERPGDVRADDGAAVRERAVGDGELERRHLEQALADREVDGLARVPDRVARLQALQVPGSRDRTARLPREIEARRVADAEQPCPPLHVDRARARLPEIEQVADPVEPRVARDRQGLG